MFLKYLQEKQVKKILLLGKVPPIEGGTSSQTISLAIYLAKKGFEIHILSNSLEVEIGYKQQFLIEDYIYYKKILHKNIFFHFLKNDFQEKKYKHIPFSQAYTERLFGRGIEIIENNNIDVIYGEYYQPYGFTASLLGNFFNIPFVINNAGSDIKRLSKNIDLRKSYKWMLQKADKIISESNSILLENTFGFSDINNKKISLDRRVHFPIFFNNKVKELDISRYQKLFHNNYGLYFPYDEQKILSRLDNIDKNKIIIGVYGKIGHSKGHYDLLRALLKLDKLGIDFQLIFIGGGNESILLEFYNFIHNNKVILKYMWFIPFIPYFKIPNFIKSCDVVYFGERDFPVDIHTPLILYEVLSVGSCLLCSKESKNKSKFKKQLINGKNFVEIDNPKNIDSLSIILQKIINKEINYKKIGENGYNMLKDYNSN